MKKASKKVSAKKATKSAVKRGKATTASRAKTSEKPMRNASANRTQRKIAISNVQPSRNSKKISSSTELPFVAPKRPNEAKKDARTSQSDTNRKKLVAAELPNAVDSTNHKIRRNGEANDRAAAPLAAGKSRGGAKKPTSESSGRTRPEPERPPVKTHLNEKQLAEFKELLLLKRAQLTGDVQGLATEARGRSAQGDNEHSNMPIHMADLGSDTWEQDFTLGLIVNAESVVREIDAALERIKEKTYGVCTVGDDRIGIARLRAKPWAKYCIDHARLIEEGRLP